jgi:hypothetical protein
MPSPEVNIFLKKISRGKYRSRRYGIVTGSPSFQKKKSNGQSHESIPLATDTEAVTPAGRTPCPNHEWEAAVHVASGGAAESGGSRSPLAGALSILPPRRFPAPRPDPSCGCPRAADATVKYQTAVTSPADRRQPATNSATGRT